MATLLQQVKEGQISNCMYHSSASSPSLYQDHVCDRSNFPVTTFIELREHTDEVWHVVFSHDGTRLASCGSDGVVFIYEVGSFEVVHTLREHEDGIGAVAWSPDDSIIVTGSLDRRARLWNARVCCTTIFHLINANLDQSGELIRTLPRFGQPVSSCVWAPDGESFVTGCLDTERNLCQWNLNGEVIYDWGQNHRIQDLALSPDGNRLIAMEHQDHVYVYNFLTRELEYEINLKVKLVSVAISQNSRHLLVNKNDGESRMFDLDTRETVRVFSSGDRQAKFIIRSGFGGANESFVITGSEGMFKLSTYDRISLTRYLDGHVYIWHKDNGTLVERLNGHDDKGCCNSVSWNPADPCMFASAGDDKIVRM